MALMQVDIKVIILLFSSTFLTSCVLPSLLLTVIVEFTGFLRVG